ncbi:MAG TPA: serine/threonine-protein kinase [Polyangiaceae bacterium]|jgi:serine/threonine protein kinase|nr:serine/threonine-protein kinase [Polyangiaceae bacterium]
MDRVEELAARAGLREGQILDSRYRIERVLGAGGMGVVVAARNVHLDTRVALKLLLPEVLQNGEAVTRFAREARASARLQNEHVARVHDVGVLENGAPYMVMEYLEGEDLARRLETQGPLSVRQAVDFVIQAGVAVAEAHAMGIVHRDLKPANLFCTTRMDGQPLIKVLDFGISKVIGAGAGASGAITRTAATMGTPHFMSPEQVVDAKSVDPRTDIWSMGVILFVLLTQQVPFPGDEFGQVVVRVSMNPTPPFAITGPRCRSGSRR